MTLPQLDFTDFGFKANPFSITPDPHYLFMSARHEESLAHLLYGAGPNGGFVQLTGEVGTGKTLLIRALLDQAIADVTLAYIFNPRLSRREFLAAVCDEFSVSYINPPPSSKQLLDKLVRYLLEIYSQGRRAVLIIDEAQNLSPGVLETIRLLTNLETSNHKLLRIILVGQPELENLLGRKELRQVAQRITARCTLTPLQGYETLAYVKHRMTVAGLPEGLFKTSALWLVHLLSGGVPRVINTLCERALLGLYARGGIRVGARLIFKSAQEIASPDSVFKTMLRQFASIGILVFGGIGLVLASMPDMTLLEGERLSSQQREAVVAKVSDTVSEHQQNDQRKPVRSGYYRSNPFGLFRAAGIAQPANAAAPLPLPVPSTKARTRAVETAIKVAGCFFESHGTLKAWASSPTIYLCILVAVSRVVAAKAATKTPIIVRAIFPGIP